MKVSFIHASIATKIDPRELFSCLEFATEDRPATPYDILQFLKTNLYSKDPESGLFEDMDSFVWGFYGDYHYSPAMEAVRTILFEKSCDLDFRGITKVEFKKAFSEYRNNNQVQDGTELDYYL